MDVTTEDTNKEMSTSLSETTNDSTSTRRNMQPRQLAIGTITSQPASNSAVENAKAKDAPAPVSADVLEEHGSRRRKSLIEKFPLRIRDQNGEDYSNYKELRTVSVGPQAEEEETGPRWMSPTPAFEHRETPRRKSLIEKFPLISRNREIEKKSSNTDQELNVSDLVTPKFEKQERPRRRKSIIEKLPLISRTQEIDESSSSLERDVPVQSAPAFEVQERPRRRKSIIEKLPLISRTQEIEESSSPLEAEAPVNKFHDLRSTTKTHQSAKTRKSIVKKEFEEFVAWHVDEPWRKPLLLLWIILFVMVPAIFPLFVVALFMIKRLKRGLDKLLDILDLDRRMSFCINRIKTKTR